MPEGDTIWLAARRLDDALAGATVTRCDLRVPHLATVSLVGQTLTTVAPAGKHLLMRFDGGWTLHSHLRMDGSWHLYRPGQRWRGGPGFTVRALLGTADWVAVGYRVHDLAVLRSTDEHRLIGHLGPDVLHADRWDSAAALQRLLASPDEEIGLALLDQRILAGPGNIYRCEAMFLAGVHPWQPVAAVADPAALLDRVHSLMAANRGRPQQSTTGEDAHGRAHYVHGRNRQPCRRCGTLIRTAAQGAAPRARITYWCPSCQSPHSVTD